MVSKMDTRMDVRVKISTLWLIVMLNMIYADILAFVSAFITPGVIEQLMNGYSGTVKLSQELLLISAFFIEIPILMIFLSRCLSYRLNKWLNIIAAILTAMFIVGGLETQPFFLFLATVELSVIGCIVWIVVRWDSKKQKTADHSSYHNQSSENIDKTKIAKA